MPEQEVTEKDSKKKKSKELSEEELNKRTMINDYGSKLSRLSWWLKELFADDTKHRAILFSKFTDYLYVVADLLKRADIPCAFLEGYGPSMTLIIYMI